MTRWIAVDWGTTTLRATLVDDASPVASRDSRDGMSTLAPDAFEPALTALAGDWLNDTNDIVACGMVGARQGWIEAPYRPVPCTPLAGPLATAPAATAGLRVRIVPGLSQARPHPDVIRGEETQIAGILAASPGFDGVACLPGTHTKWVHLSAGEVVSFRTVMTGEVFATLAARTVLRHSLTGEGFAEAPFLDAVSDALSRPEIVTGRLFELRAADLLEGQDAATGRSLLSGLLIGAELAATRAWWLGRDVVLTGAPEVSRVYDLALRAQGIAPRLLPAAAMTLAGLAAARELP